MLSPKRYYIASISVLAIASLVACSNTKKEEKSLSYQFSYNGCDTGKKSFNNQTDYCNSLLDDAANNYCASSLRMADYKRSCGSLKNSTKSTEASPVPPQITTSNPAAQGTTTREQDGPPAETPTITQRSQTTESAKNDSTPDSITITGRFNPSPKFESKESGSDSILVSLAGEIEVSSVEPEIKTRLMLGFAEKFQFTNDTLGNCQTSYRMFNSKNSDNKLIEFSILAIDKRNPVESSDCMPRLSAAAYAGFTIEFTNVPVSGSSDVVPKVILKIEN